MRFVIEGATPGSLELNYPFLPTFIGMHGPLQEKLEKALGPKLQGRDWNEQTFDEANDMVIEFLVAEFPLILGLRDYLESIKYVSIDGTKKAG